MKEELGVSGFDIKKLGLSHIKGQIRIWENDDFEAPFLSRTSAIHGKYSGYPHKRVLSETTTAICRYFSLSAGNILPRSSMKVFLSTANSGSLYSGSMADEGKSKEISTLPYLSCKFIEASISAPGYFSNLTKSKIKIILL